MDEIYLIYVAIVILILSIALMVIIFRAINRRNPPQPNTMAAEDGNTQTRLQSAPMNSGAEKEEKPAITQHKVRHEPTRPSSEKEIAESIPDKIYPDIDLTTDSLSMLESMNRLCQKYNIETCTLASMDGLAIASSYTGGTRDAAHFSNLYLRENITRQGDAIISPLKFQNQDLIIIIRSQRNLNSEEIEVIKSDEKRILLYWL
jgi:hypothetical protein